RVPEEHLPRYAAHLGQLLELFAAMQAVDTSGVGAVVATFEDLSLQPRPDLAAGSLPRDAALAPSQRREGDFIAVPRVLGGATLEEG
ncbi:MAG TPA: Asp-tRNA(Asn)/Glu-tRNA(Gln) amidotransferase subunit GatC, partial [bacterium]|nr:Asp-tRNA(Asn)/Glu-tRNA(Gln) amidotransferase subunit GatC [bacterium]